jgi:hypothetical protein
MKTNLLFRPGIGVPQVLRCRLAQYHQSIRHVSFGWGPSVWLLRSSRCPVPGIFGAPNFKILSTLSTTGTTPRSNTRDVSDDVAVPLKLLNMVYAFRNRGHFAAELDPLIAVDNGRISSWLPEDPEKHPDVVRFIRRYPSHLDLKPFHLENTSLSKKYYLGNEIRASTGQTEWTVPELVGFLCQTYCSSAGFEFSHVDSGKRLVVSVLAHICLY